jgi:hypothetical protein
VDLKRVGRSLGRMPGRGTALRHNAAAQHNPLPGFGSDARPWHRILAHHSGTASPVAGLWLGCFALHSSRTSDEAPDARAVRRHRSRSRHRSRDRSRDRSRSGSRGRSRGRPEGRTRRNVGDVD